VTSEKSAYRDPSLPVETRVEDLLSRMTLEEKVAQLSACMPRSLVSTEGLDDRKMRQLLKHGIGHVTRIAGSLNQAPEISAAMGNTIQRYLVESTRLGIPAIIHDECLTSFMSKGATVFPQPIGVAATWDPDLVEEMAKTIRDQMICTGARQGLAPVLDIVRDARWGRTGENFGEDPYLVSRLAIAYVRGLQGDDLRNGVIATAKHFLGYGASEGGMNWAPSHINKRELLEVYARPFEAAIREAQLASVMPCFNEIDGIPLSASKAILTDLLRDTLGFEGVAVSDYQAIVEVCNYHRAAKDNEDAGVKSFLAGMDVELPQVECYGHVLAGAVRNGRVSEERIDVSVRRHLSAKFRLGLFENPYVDVEKVRTVFLNPENGRRAREVAAKSIVLLRNQGILPLKKDLSSIALIGPCAHSLREFFGSFAQIGRTEGITYMIMEHAGNHPLGKQRESFIKGGGMNRFGEFINQEDDDAVCRKNYEMNTVRELFLERFSSGTTINYAKGCDINSTRTDGIPDAVKAAAESQVAVLILGERVGLTDKCTSGEAKDRSNLNLPGVQQMLLEEVSSTGTPVVVVLVNDRPLSIGWADQHAAAIVEAWTAGEQGPQAIVDILLGEANPGGKLPMSFPRSVGQLPQYYNHKPSGGRSKWFIDYADGPTSPLYPFGHGLSYTSFGYSNFVPRSKEVDITGTIVVSVDVMNTGTRTGDEVVQLYAHDLEANVTRPVKELVGFKRLSLSPGETSTVVFTVQLAQLAFLNEDMEWVVEPGTIELMVGSSSEDIRGRAEIKIVGSVRKLQRDRAFYNDPVVKRRDRARS
jgi:beta-glucosidase